MEGLKKLILGLRSIGVLNVLRALYTAIRRDLAERGARPRPSGPVHTPGKLKNSEAIPGGARVQFENAEVEILFLAEDLVRVTWQPGELPAGYGLADVEWMPIETEAHDTGLLFSVCSDKLQIFVTPEGMLKYLDENGQVLRIEQPPQRQDQRWTHQADLDPDEHVYGLGERAAPLNLRGGAYHMWNTDPGGSYDLGKDPLYVNIPLYLTRKADGGYLVFYENAYEARFNIEAAKGTPEEYIEFDTAYEKATAVFEGGALRYYFVPGTPAQALERYTQLTGRHVLPPRWALGYHQCRWGYKTEEDIRTVVAGFKQHKLPLGVVNLDIDYMVGYRVFTVNAERFPDLKKLSADLEADGIKLVTILDPGVKTDPNYAIYQSGLEADVFAKLPNGKLSYGQVWPGNCAFPDFTDPKARRWWGEQYALLLDAGVAGFWHDMNEPATFVAWGDGTLDIRTRHDFDGSGGSHLEAHNLYGLQMNRAGFEALREQRPEQRPWFVSRAGWAGLQRYAWNWTGDINSSWSALKMTMAMVMNLGLSGIAFTGPDIGGFSGEPTPELYTRWFQLSTFLPFFRTHSAIGIPPREPWLFGEPILSIVRDFLELRYRLMPYFYTLAWEASEKGYPLVRPLFWQFPDESQLWALDDAFMLGDVLLVAPVVEDSATTRKVTLPPGHWYNFWDDEPLEGPGEVELAVPLDKIGLLVKAGSVLPQDVDGVLQVHIYPPIDGEGKGQVYSDAGDGYGPMRLDEFSMYWEVSQLVLRHRHEGEYALPGKELELHIHRLPVARVWIDENEEPVEVEANKLAIKDFERVRFEAKQD